MTSQSLNIKNPEFKQKTGLQEGDRKAIADALGVVLADTYMLFIKTQGVHWNIMGPAFVSVHELTAGQYQNMYEAIDEIAERIRALGHKAPASYTKYGALSSIRDEDEPKTVKDMLSMLISDHETVVADMRLAVESCESKNDFVTADMMIGRMAWHEEAIWMLNALNAD